MTNKIDSAPPGGTPSFTAKAHIVSAVSHAFTALTDMPRMNFWKGRSTMFS